MATAKKAVVVKPVKAKHGKREEAAEMKGMSPKQMAAHMKGAEERMEYRAGGKVGAKKKKGC